MELKYNKKVQLYIEQVCSRVKFREAHEEIRMELEDHLQERVQEFIEEEFAQDEAVDKAIEQMGEASLVGEQLNKVHKPQPEWGVLAISIVFISFGLLAMYFMERHGVLNINVTIFERTLIFTILGILFMTGLYYFDYRKLERYSIHIYLGNLTLLLLTFGLFGRKVGGKVWLSIGTIQVDILSISAFLFIIAIAGILNRWNWIEPKKIGQGLLLILVPMVVLAIGGSFDAVLIYSIACMVMLIGSGIKLRYILTSLAFFISILTMFIVSAPYRLQRLLAFINPQTDPLGNGWIYLQLRQLIESAGFLGRGFNQEVAILPEVHTDFIFTYLVYTFGWLSGMLLVALAAVFLFRVANISKIVKSNYAKHLITGIVVYFALQFSGNIFMNLGLGPMIGVGLPFISYGGSQLIINAMALGLISSIYRRRFFSDNYKSDKDIFTTE